MQSKLITLAGEIKGDGAADVVSKIRLLQETLAREEVKFYYPTSADYLVVNLLSMMVTPDVNGKTAAFEIKLSQQNANWQGAEVNVVFDSLASRSQFSVNYSGTKACGLRMQITPTNEISDLFISSARKETGRFLRKIKAGSSLLLDRENSQVLLEQLNAWSDYQGELFTLNKGNNEFALEFTGGGTVNVSLDYQVGYY